MVTAGAVFTSLVLVVIAGVLVSVLTSGGTGVGAVEAGAGAASAFFSFSANLKSPLDK